MEDNNYASIQTNQPTIRAQTENFQLNNNDKINK